MSFPAPFPSPLLAKAQSLGIRPEDTEEMFIRGSGHGGQKINKTSLCVQLTHRPTGITVRCQKHREQSKNRLSAWKLLILRIEEKVRGVESDRQKAIFKLRKQKQRRTRRAKERMLEDKRQRADIKENRRPIV
jgi:protein subunit release factor B